ncbi:MAG: hypothetical protein HC892_21170 [Saprospiraceae bacterium]|nr:hypothetical protein [Saprospiraceae bacterium]
MRTWLLLLLSFSIELSAQIPKLTFEYISNREGLPSNDVCWATEDDKGFLWIGTRRCLARYDGYAFKQFGFTKTHSVVADSNLIYFTEESFQLKVLDINNLSYRPLIGEKDGGGYTVFLDTKGRVWLSDRDGIICYHPKTGKHKKYPLKSTTF